MMHIFMQLRKVCNHPDLFEGRSIRAPFTTESLRYHVPDLVVNDAIPDPSQLSANVPFVTSQEKSAWECDKARALHRKRDTILRMKERPYEKCNFPGFLAKVQADLLKERKRFRESMAEINASRCKSFDGSKQFGRRLRTVKVELGHKVPHRSAALQHERKVQEQVAQALFR